LDDVHRECRHGGADGEAPVGELMVFHHAAGRPANRGPSINEKSGSAVQTAEPLSRIAS